MRKFLQAALAALLLVVFAYTPVTRYQQIAHRWSPQDVWKYTQTVSVITVYFQDGTACSGAGVLIAEDGTTLTAAHLFDGKVDRVEMFATNGNTYDMAPLGVNFRRDLALIRPVASAQKFVYAKLARGQEVEVNQDIVAIGHPLLYYWHAEFGLVLRQVWHPIYGGDILMISALVRPGNSGGPVFNTKGELLGIVSAYSYQPLTGEYRYGIAIALYEIKEFLKTAEANRPYWRKQIKRYRLGDVK